MLKIHPIMNSAVEEIFGFKTCCGLRAFDQNLEIHVKNLGLYPVIVPSHFELEGDYGNRRTDTLMPPGDQRIDPGQTVAFYCFMDQTIWDASRHMVFYDGEGNEYRIPLIHENS